MCASPYDCAYAAYGGIMPRANQFHGRVGSILDPAAVIKVEADQKADEPTPAEIPDNSGEITAIPLDSDSTDSHEMDLDLSLTSDVEEVFDPDQEFEPFGAEFAELAKSGREEEMGLSSEEEPDLVGFVDAESLNREAVEAKSVMQTTAIEPAATDVETTNPPTLRLIDATGSELPISE